MKRISLKKSTRRNSKFIFTRSISDILEIIKFYAKEKNIKLNDLNNYKIDQILKSFTSKQVIKKNRYEHYDKNSEYYDFESVLSDRIAILTAYINDDECFIRSIEVTDKTDNFWVENIEKNNYKCILD